MTVTANVGLLVLRLVVGLILAAHGAQKLGWFGGPGLAKVRQGFEHRGLRPGWLWVGLAVVGELGGGISVALGFLTPLGAAGILGAMFMAGMTHWKKGFWLQKGGYEYTLALLAVSVAIGLIGPGAYSLDALFGIALPEALLFGVLALAALLVDGIGLFISSNRARPVVAESQSSAS
jgi:putative oxidoreductase